VTDVGKGKGIDLNSSNPLEIFGMMYRTPLLLMGNLAAAHSSADPAWIKVLNPATGQASKINEDISARGKMFTKRKEQP